MPQDAQDRLWSAQQQLPDAHWEASAPRQRTLARRVLRKCQELDDTVLTIGVGSGWLEYELARKGLTVIAVDPVYHTHSQMSNSLQFRQGYSDAIPCNSNYIAAVVMSETLEHVQINKVTPTLKEIWRVLRPGGWLYLTVPMNEDLSQGHVTCPYCDANFHRWGHESSFNKGKLRGLLAANGFHTPVIRPCAFADFHRDTMTGLVRSCARALLGRLGQKIVNPVWDVHAWKYPVQYHVS